MRRFLVVAGACVWWMSNFPVQAAEIQLLRSPANDGSAIAILEGNILAGDARRLEVVAGQGNLRGLVVSSPGGLISEALKLGEIVQRLRLPVQAHGVCASACPVILLASPQRSITRDTRIGFHSVRTRAGEAHEGTVQLARIYRELGVPNEILGGLVTHAPNEMYWINDNQMRSMEISIRPSLLDQGNHERNIVSREFYDILKMYSPFVLAIVVFGFLFWRIMVDYVWRRQTNQTTKYAPLSSGMQSAPITQVAAGCSPAHAKGALSRMPSAGSATSASSCSNCGQPLSGGRFNACPACGHDLTHAWTGSNGRRPQP